MIRPAVDDDKLKQAIGAALDEFYRRRIEKLSQLKLIHLLRRKNPYLFRALGIEKASDLVEQIMTSFVWSSDEGIFGDAFFEKVARDYCTLSSAPTDGIDFVIEDENEIVAISLKSGPNIFNASQSKRQAQEFQKHQSRVRNLKKKYTAVLAAGYGRVNKPPTETRIYTHIAGQAFWELITGDDDFYQKLHRLMGETPQLRSGEHKSEWAKLVNKFTTEFMERFSTEDHAIDWDKLVECNSGKQVPVTKKKTGKKREEKKLGNPES